MVVLRRGSLFGHDDGPMKGVVVRVALLCYWAYLAGLCVLFHGLVENWA